MQDHQQSRAEAEKNHGGLRHEWSGMHVRRVTAKQTTPGRKAARRGLHTARGREDEQAAHPVRPLQTWGLRTSNFELDALHYIL